MFLIGSSCNCYLILGMANWRLVNLVCNQGSTDRSGIVYHCKQAFKHFSYSFLHGQKAKSPDWIEGTFYNKLETVKLGFPYVIIKALKFHYSYCQDQLFLVQDG